MVDKSSANNLLDDYNDLSPDIILQAIENSTGFETTGRLIALNSLENRVYEIELQVDENSSDPSNKSCVAKFYRPGRWSKEQILEEHQFLLDLVEYEIPAVAPILFHDKQTLHKLDAQDIYYTVFPKKSGRTADELNSSQVEMIGRLLARIHEVGKLRGAPNRLTINPQTYGRNNLSYLIDNDYLPLEFKNTYGDLVKTICDISEPWFEQTQNQRIHGDCHMGNLIDRDGKYFFVDFDDMLQGPCIQDLWLIVPGHDDYSKKLWNSMLNGYEDFSDFDYRSMRLIEPLRALRFIHFSAWIAKRCTEDSFINAFPSFNHPNYWQSQIYDLTAQLELIKELACSSSY